jgi:hypothetical protein
VNPRTVADQRQYGWIAVDLDGTLAVYDGWKGADHIGEPIPDMLFRVRKWLAEGRDVRIFTARAYSDGTPERDIEAKLARMAIVKWCREHFNQVLPITCIKDYAMLELWDDRAVQVEANTGKLIGRSTRGLS